MTKHHRYPEAIFLKSFFQGMKDSGIPYAVMRNYETLPFSLGGSDLDILFPHSKKVEVFRLLDIALYQAGGSVIGKIETKGFSKLFVFGKESEEWWGMPLDCFFGIFYFGSSELVDDKLLWNRLTDHNGVSVLPSGTAALLGVLKEVLYNDSLPRRYLLEARNAVDEDWDVQSKIFSPLGCRALDIFKSLIYLEPGDERVPLLSKRLRGAVFQEAFRRSPGFYLAGLFMFLFSRARRVVSPQGLTIAILGTDGSGKSTIIEAITPVLDAATHGAFRIQHLRPGLFPPLANLFKRKEAQERGPVTNPHGSRPSGLVGSLFRLSYLLGDYVLGYWLKVRPVIAKSPTIYLFDRYAYDLEMDPRRFRIRLPVWLLRLATRLVPKPDLIFCLDGDPEIITSRKNELPLQEIERQIQFIRAFADREPKAVLISTTCRVEETRDQVLNALLQYCRERNSPLKDI